MRKIFTLSILFAATVVVSITASGPGAQADPICSFSSKTAIADGQAQTVSTSGCKEDVPFQKGPLGASVSGSLTLSDGKITTNEQTTGNAQLALAGTAKTTVRANFSDFAKAILNFFGQSVSIGNINYNLSTVALDLKGTAKATVNNGNQAEGGFINFNVGDNVLDFLVNNQSQTPSSPQGNSKDIGPCGGTFGGNVCPGVNQSFLVPANLTIPVGASGLDFELDLTGEFQLITTKPGAGASIDASDPFEIDTMGLVDANGTVIPGITFTADDGFVFPSEPAPGGAAAVPEPASLALLGTGLAGLAALRRRRPRT